MMMSRRISHLQHQRRVTGEIIHRNQSLDGVGVMHHEHLMRRPHGHRNQSINSSFEKQTRCWKCWDSRGHGKELGACGKGRT